MYGITKTPRYLALGGPVLKSGWENSSPSWSRRRHRVLKLYRRLGSDVRGRVDEFEQNQV